MKILYGATFTYKNMSASAAFSNDKMLIEMRNVLIRNNYGIRGVSVHGSDLYFTGKHNAFIKNTSPFIGGGLILSTDNSIFVNKGHRVLFANNTAYNFGGAIYINNKDLENSNDVYGAFTLFHEARKCSFMSNQEMSTCIKTQSLITFEGNKVHIAGDDVYGGIYEFCVTGQCNNYIQLLRERSIVFKVWYINIGLFHIMVLFLLYQRLFVLVLMEHTTAV